jgi:hypothetical protein
MTAIPSCSETSTSDTPTAGAAVSDAPPFQARAKDASPMAILEGTTQAERRLRLLRTVQRLVKATAELEALKPKDIVELASLTPRDRQMPLRRGNRL